jgi:putative thioredoxin
MSKYDTDDFNVDVIERSYEKPVLVDFWAAWCGPCRIIGPVLERLADQNGENWELRKLDTEKYPAIASQFRISSIPAVKLFVDGKVKDEFVGALPEQSIVQWLQKALPSKFREQLKQAQQLLADGKAGEAHYLLESIVEADPSNEQAIALTAQIELYSDPQKAMETASRIPIGSEHFESAEAIKAIANLFEHLESPDALEEAPIKPAYLHAIQLLRESRFAAALESFINVIMKSRYYDDDGSRKAVIAVFKLLGEEHDITKKYRNPFANALY